MQIWANLLLPPAAALFFFWLAGGMPSDHILGVILAFVGGAFMFLLWPVTAVLAIRDLFRAFRAPATTADKGPSRRA